MILKIAKLFLKLLFKDIYNRRYISNPIYFKHIFTQKILRINSKAYWPVDWRSTVIGTEYIYVGTGSAPAYGFGSYITASKDAPIYIGNYSIFAPNVIMPSRNHNIYNYREHTSGGIKIGNYCWIGANSTILPNVELGDHTIVGAGSVVTKSFPNGYVIIAGNPAKIIKTIEKTKCIEVKDKFEYHGYIRKENFQKYRKKYLKV